MYENVHSTWEKREIIAKPQRIVTAAQHRTEITLKVIRHKGIGIFGNCMVIYFITRFSYHTYFTSISTSWYRRFWTGCIVHIGEWRIFVNYSVIAAPFPPTPRVLLRKAYMAHQYKKMLYHPWFYRITMDENPIPLKCINVLSNLCLRLTKVQFETSFKSFQYNTKGRRLSNHSIKMILCSHYRSSYIRGCVNIESMDFTNIPREVTFAPHI